MHAGLLLVHFRTSNAYSASIPSQQKSIVTLKATESRLARPGLV